MILKNYKFEFCVSASDVFRNVASGVGVSFPQSHILHLPAFHGHFRKFYRGSSHGKKIKNLWRRKCVRRAILRTVEVRVEGRFVPFNPFFVCNTAIGSLCDNFYWYNFSIKKSLDFPVKTLKFSCKNFYKFSGKFGIARSSGVFFFLRRLCLRRKKRPEAFFCPNLRRNLRLRSSV